MSDRGKPGFDPYCTRPDTEVPASGQFLPERPVSVITVGIRRTAFEADDAWRPSMDRTLGPGSGQVDQSIRSERRVPSEGVQRLYFMGASI